MLVILEEIFPPTGMSQSFGSDQSISDQTSVFESAFGAFCSHSEAPQ